MPSGNGYTAIQPDLSLSWLHDGWNVSADLHLAVPVTADSMGGYKYWSGNEFAADYTVTKTLGNWTFGTGMDELNQLNAGTKDGKTVPDSSVTTFGLGPIAGYQFPCIGILAEWSHSLDTRNDIGGDIFNTRLVVPF